MQTFADMKAKNLTAVACAAALLAGGAVVAIASADNDGEKNAAAPIGAVRELSPKEFNRVTTAVPAVQQQILDQFRIFRDQMPSAIPTDVAEQIASPKRWGRNPNLARKIKTVTGDGWVIPGDGFLCIAIPDPVDGFGTTCQPTQMAAARGLQVGLSGGKGVPAGKSAQVALVSDATAIKLKAKGIDVDDSGSILTGFTDGEIVPSSVR